MSEHKQVNASLRRKKLAISGLLALLSGVFYYLWFRNTEGSAVDPSLGTYPSLVHMLALTWLAIALSGTRRGVQISIVLLVISLIAERYLSFFDPADALMLVLGFLVGGVTGCYYLRELPQHVFKFGIPLVSTGLVCTASVMIMGSTCFSVECGDDRRGYSYRSAQPIYMDYQTLRNSITVSEPRPLSNIGRVYVYQNAVFLNKKNEGIHVLDNSDPTSPRNVAFIEIPGNTELSIRDGYLYVDSYIDLVTIDIRDQQTIYVVDRQNAVFPYDPYQNITDDVYLDAYVDQDRGVVVGYEFIETNDSRKEGVSNDN